MSHPIIHIGRYHGGSDDWRTPYRLFRNLHHEYSFSLDGAATEHDALLPRFTVCKLRSDIQEHTP